MDDQVGEDPGQEERGETQWDDVSRKENSNFYWLTRYWGTFPAPSASCCRSSDDTAICDRNLRTAALGAVCRNLEGDNAFWRLELEIVRLSFERGEPRFRSIATPQFHCQFRASLDNSTNYLSTVAMNLVVRAPSSSPRDPVGKKDASREFHGGKTADRVDTDRRLSFFLSTRVVESNVVKLGKNWEQKLRATSWELESFWKRETCRSFYRGFN